MNNVSILGTVLQNETTEQNYEPNYGTKLRNQLHTTKQKRGTKCTTKLQNKL